MTSDVGARLFCLPYAGGSAAVYRAWAGALAPRVSVVAVELPGHGRRISEPLCTSASALVDGLIAELVDDMQSRPFAIFGHSLGGLLAFQMTHELVRRGLPRPVRLFLSAARLPKPMAGEPLHALADAELLAVLERLNGAPPEALAHRGLMEIMLPIVRADLRLAETWSFHSGEALDIPVSLLGGLWDPLTPPAEMERWRQYFSGQVDHRSYPGHHFYLLEQEAQLLRYLGDAVSAALLPSSESS